MIKAHQKMLKKLSPEMREAVEPFVQEYEALCQGEKKEIKVYFGYTKSGVPETEALIDATFIWEVDNRTSFTCKLKKRWLNPCYASDKPVKPKPILGNLQTLCEFFVENSPQCAEFNNRIRNFVKETEAVGKAKFGNKDALWMDFFWDSPLNY